MGHLPYFLKWVIFHVGFPLVFFYHQVMWSPFVNVKADDARGFEEVGNVFLMPTQYLCSGKKALPDGEGSYVIYQRFDYNRDFVLRTSSAVLASPITFPIGCLTKGLAYFSPQTRERHKKIVKAIREKKPLTFTEYYREIGLNVSSPQEMIAPPTHAREPGSEKHLQDEKEALAAIGLLLEEAGIPYWLDLGSCLGAYRYGGVIPWDFDIDMAVLSTDFDNVFCALQKLDPEKYQVQDWSSRRTGDPFLKVYVRSSQSLIDIFHYCMDPETKELQLIVANEDSLFLSDKWREHERRYADPVAFDTVFPLKKASFDGLTVPVPQKTKIYLQSKYGENIEPARVYSEETGCYEKDLSHPYWQRANVY